MIFDFLRSKRPKPNPPWLKWGVLVFIGYALASNMLHPKTHGPQQPATATAENLNPQKFLHLDEYKNRLLPSYEAPLKIKDEEEGSGLPAVCGQQVKIAYFATLPNGDAAGDSATPEQPLSFGIGHHNVMAALEQGVIGMKKDGKRDVVAQPKMAYGSPEFTKANVPADSEIKFDIKLLDLSPALPDPSETPYRIAEVTDGSGPMILCGERVKANITIWSTEGKKLYATKQPVTFTPGQSEVFLGLEQGVLALNRGGSRTLIVPPAFQKTMNGNPPVVDIPLPAHQTALVDVETLP